ncbi:MAG: RDD family protein [Planctomycetota bacterium]
MRGRKREGYLLDPDGLDKGPKTATCGRRVAGFLIDLPLLWMISAIWANFLLHTGLIPVVWSSVWEVWMLWVPALLIYYVPLEMVFGRTVGKLLVQTKVVKAETGSVGLGHVLGRTLARAIPFEPLSVLASSGRMWHDSLSGTVVVSRGSLTTARKLVIALIMVFWMTAIAGIVVWVEPGGPQNLTAGLLYTGRPPELERGPRPLSSEEHTALLQSYGEELSGQDQAQMMILLKKMLDVLGREEAERFLDLHAKGMVDISQAEIEERVRLQQKALSGLSQVEREQFEVLLLKAAGFHAEDGSGDQALGAVTGALSPEELAEMQRLMDKSLSLLSEGDFMRLLELHALFRGEGARQITSKEWQEMHELNKKALSLLSAEEQARFQKLTLKGAGFSKDARRERRNESP